MFDTLTIRDARPIAWLKRAIVAVFAALLVIGGLSAHRAYFQVRSLEVKAPQLLIDGSVVEVAVVCSGRNRVGVEAELIQGEYFEALLNFRVPGNNLAFFDPRARHATQTAVLNTETLNRFQTRRCRYSRRRNRPSSVGSHSTANHPRTSRHDSNTLDHCAPGESVR